MPHRCLCTCVTRARVADVLCSMSRCDSEMHARTHMAGDEAQGAVLEPLIAVVRITQLGMQALQVCARGDVLDGIFPHGRHPLLQRPCLPRAVRLEACTPSHARL